MSSRRSLQTILFTDIVASTNRATELGDRGWSELLQEHHHRVRREIQRFGGREIKALGDGFLAAFPRPSQAIRCAWAIRESTRELGLEVRGGIHVGEVEQQGSDLSGIAVHICSRIAAAAAPGEILVSNAVREMETGSGFRFQDRGKHELKGVSGEWRLFALESLPAGTTFRTGRWIPELSTRQARIAVASIIGILLVTMTLWAVRGRTQSGGTSESGIVATAAPGIAVLPFTVQGAGLEVMREGMVSLLSTGLDGAGGLRTIAPGTVFARWREQVSGEETPELPVALEIARRTGASYALLGSVVSIGSNIRVVADVYETSSGERLGQGQVEGSPDSVLPLIDRLGVEVLRVILQRGERELPEIDMAGLTTDSPQALKSYLEGEVHLRHFDLDAARDAYTRAVAADSMFALAHSRLCQAYGWAPVNSSLSRRHCTRAAQLSDRLPTREALLIRALRATERGVVDAIEALREAARTYPDDAEIWYQLGETLLHTPGAMATAAEVEAPFERAVQLDPGNAEYLNHYTEFAWTIYADSQEAARRLHMFERAASEQNPRSREFRLALGLAFGDPTAQEDVRALLASEPFNTVARVSGLLRHPRYQQSLTVTQMAFQRSDDHEVISAIWVAFLNHSYYGKFSEFLDLLEDPRIDWHFRAVFLYDVSTLGYPVPTEILEQAIGSIPIDSTAGLFPIGTVGLYMADQGDWSDHERVIAELERRAALALAEADSLGAWHRKGRANAVRGYGLWRSKGPENALPFLSDPNHTYDWLWWWWLGQLYQELGRFRDAEQVYRTYQPPDAWPISVHPLAHRELGRVYEELGEYDEALESYKYFIEYWKDADPEVQPMVEEARQAVIRIQGLRRE